MDAALLIDFLGATVRIATPLLLAAMGGILIRTRRHLRGRPRRHDAGRRVLRRGRRILSGSIVAGLARRGSAALAGRRGGRGRDARLRHRADGNRARREHPRARADQLPAARRWSAAAGAGDPRPAARSRAGPRPRRPALRRPGAVPPAAADLPGAPGCRGRGLPVAHARRARAARRRREPPRGVRRRHRPGRGCAFGVAVAGGALAGLGRRRALAAAGRHLHRRHDQRPRLHRAGRHHRRPLDAARHARRLPACSAPPKRCSCGCRPSACRSAPT